MSEILHTSLCPTYTVIHTATADELLDLLLDHVKVKTPQFKYEAWLAEVDAAAKSDSRSRKDIGKYRTAEYNVHPGDQYRSVKTAMKLAPGYPEFPSECDRTAGHALRTKNRNTSRAVFTVEYLAGEDMIFTELYQRSLFKKHKK